MKGLENRSDFENEWQKAFSNEEAEPSEEVWTRIDAFLANGEATFYKRKAFYYKLVAAASLIFAVGFGMWALMGRSGKSTEIAGMQSDQQTIVEQREGQQQESSSNSMKAMDEKQGVLAENSGNNLDRGDHKNSTSVAGTLDRGVHSSLKEDPSGPIAFNQNEPSGQAVDPSSKNAFLPAGARTAENQGDEKNALLAKAQKLGIPELQANLIPKNQQVNRVLDVTALFAVIKPKHESSNFWAGIAFSGGNFDPEFSRGSGNIGLDALYTLSGGNNSNWSESTQRSFIDVSNGLSPGNTFNSNSINNKTEPGIAYSMGFNVGGKVTPRIVLQSGLFYAKRMTSTSTSAFMVDNDNKVYPVHVSNLASATSSDYHLFNYQFTDMPISSNYQFLSVPVKVGYNFMDKKFGATVFSGVASEFFMSNKLDGRDSGGLEAVTIRSGSDSPYRNVWFNGLVSMELKYNFGGMYSAFIEPSYKISLNSMTKPEFVYKSYPRSFNVGVGLKVNLE